MTTGESALEKSALALLSGILVAVPFLIPALWWLHYVALIPWIVLVTRPGLRRTWLYFLLGAYTFLIMALGSLSLFHKAVPFAVAALYAPFLIPFALLVRFFYLRLRLPLTLIVPVAWVTTEWLRLHFSLGEVAFFPLGSSQFMQTTLIQVADLTGVYGISFFVAAANGAIVDAARAVRARDWRVAAVPVASYLVLLLAVWGYGRGRLAALRVVPGPRLALIQPNTTHYRDPARALQAYEQQISFTRSAVAPGSADVIVWPENAIGEPITDNPRYLDGLVALAREKSARLLIGGYSWADSTRTQIHTSAFYLAPDGSVLGRYDKIHLIPYSEYTPFRGWLRRTGSALALSLLGYASIGVAGTDVVRFPIRTDSARGSETNFAVPICFEVSSSSFARRAAADGADFLINITSEGLLGPPMYVHMLAHSTLRAVEHRMAVVRVANSGLSGYIDPSGRAHIMPGPRGGWLFRDAGILVERIPLTVGGSGTFYTRHGDVLAYGCLVGTLALLAWAFARMRSSAASAPTTEMRPAP